MSNNLVVNEVSKKYGNNFALNKISLSFDEGIYGLLGHNGAGKTTLMNIITGITNYEGNILFNAQNIKELKENYKAIIGYVPQQQNLDISLNVEEFLYYISGLKGIRNPKDRISSLLKELELYEHRKKKLSQLSGGMKQRVMISQALLNDPIILLLDEPTAGLDPIQRKNLRNIIARVSKNKIVIIATHIISDIEMIANEIIFLKQGVVISRNTQEYFLNNIKVFETFENIENIQNNDDTIKIVNIMRIGNSYRTRFISKKDYENRVQANMDDVYIEWLG